MRFDWYAATIQARAEDIVSRLRDGLGADAVVQMKGGRHGYTSGTELRRDGGLLAVVLAGGVNRWPNAKASGSSTENFVDVVRAEFGGAHHVSRLDACEDFDERGAFDRLYADCTSFAKDRGLRTTFMQSAGRDGNEGRTLYVGSPSSDCRVRLYEKGHEMRGRFPGRASEFSPDWVRIEAQVRPQDEARVKASTVSPHEAWGFSQTSRQLARRCLGVEVPRIAAARHDLSDYESAADQLAGQYNKTLRWLRVQSKDPATFTADLFRRADRVAWEKLKVAEGAASVLGRNEFVKKPA